jgi:hypothetical protein
MRRLTLPGLDVGCRTAGERPQAVNELALADPLAICHILSEAALDSSDYRITKPVDSESNVWERSLSGINMNPAQDIRSGVAEKGFSRQR